MPSLNDKFIRSLPTPKTRQKIYWDDKLKGLGLRITDRNVITFILDYVVDGDRKRCSIGRYPELTASAARDLATQIKGEAYQGVDALFERKASSNLPQLKEIAQDYLKSCEGVKRDKTLIEYRLMLEKHILPKLGKYRIDQIGKKEISNLHLSFKETPYRANRILELLSPIFNMAISWDLIAKNPVKGIQKFDEEKRERYLSDVEIKRLIEVLDSEENQLNTYAIKLILLTGSRKTEVLSARWQDFNLKNNTWTKPASMTKQKKISHIPLNGEALEIIKKMKSKIIPDSKINDVEEWQIVSSETYLFYNPKTKTHLQDIKKFWGRVCEKAKIKNARIHDLRHTFASVLVSNGVSLEVIGKLIGHSNITTTQRYSHLANTTLKEATNVMGNKIKNAE